LERYCSEFCRQEARQWQEWHARLTYRRTENGKERRREQSKRRRERARARAEAVAEGPPETVATPGQVAMAPVETLSSAAVDEAHQPCCEGHQRQEIPEISEGLPCSRPGCYELFAPERRSPLKKFCSCLCRMALHRVLERERRWARRLRDRSSVSRHLLAGEAGDRRRILPRRRAAAYSSRPPQAGPRPP
jgi:hypothetical protein